MADQAHRISIQWGYSHFFPPLASVNHVTHAGNHGMKFAFDVAMSGILGMDVDVDKLSPEDHAFAKAAISNYKAIRDIVQLGDQYRLESPYAGSRSAVMSVRGDGAAAFVYSLGDSVAAPLRLKGLGPMKPYRVRELDLTPGAKGLDATLDDAALLRDGLPLEAMKPYTSRVFNLVAVP